MKQKKKVERLTARQADFAKMCASTCHEQKVSVRLETGGYHKPGSMKH